VTSLAVLSRYSARSGQHLVQLTLRCLTQVIDVLHPGRPNVPKVLYQSLWICCSLLRWNRGRAQQLILFVGRAEGEVGKNV